MTLGKNNWLKIVKAAELLGVDVRTVKRWMSNPTTRNALGAVRHANQWRIPLPDVEWAWADQTRRDLKEAGIDLKPIWEQNLEKLAKRHTRNKLESYRLWLAAYSQASAKTVGLTAEDIAAILYLWQIACEILDQLPEGAELDRHKSKFPEQLKAHNFSKSETRSIMSLWPMQRNFKRVRAAKSFKDLEKFRRGMDCAQAVQTCILHNQKPTAENLRPLLHKDFLYHINDTRENLPPFVMNKMLPQNGLPLRTFRKRHPLKHSPLTKVINAALDVRNEISGSELKPRKGQMLPAGECELP